MAMTRNPEFADVLEPQDIQATSAQKNIMERISGI
jgi:hypothetical protein